MAIGARPIVVWVLNQDLRTSRDSSLSLRASRRRSSRLQPVEAVEVVLGRQHLEAAEPGFLTVAADRVRPHHRAGPGGAFPDHANGQAVEDAEPVVEALELIGR